MTRKKVGSRSTTIDGGNYAILNFLAPHIAVLDSQGIILFTNQSWNRFAQENGNPALGAVGPGANYLDTCIAAVFGGAPGAQAILSGIKDVLEHKRSAFAAEYPFDSPGQQQWFTMSATPMEKPRGGAIILHLEITRHKLGDMDEEGLLRQQEIKLVLDNSPDVIVRIDRQGRHTYVNASAAKVTTLPASALLGKTPREVGLPETLCDLWARTFQEVFDSGLPRVIEFSYPSLGADTILEGRALPEFASDGTAQSVLWIARDITERRKVERIAESRAAEIRALASRLLSAEEAERRRIARELHDNLIQKLASLANDVGGLLADLSSLDRASNRIRALQLHVANVSEEARHIAYQLHPSILDDLGLVSSLKALCNQFAVEHQIPVKFREGRLPQAMPINVASCLYRIAQESFQNIAKYARAKHVTVNLVPQRRQVILYIEDDGVGFDPSAAKHQGRLGLVSMEERALLIDARFSIESKPGHGTRVTVTVPRLD